MSAVIGRREFMAAIGAAVAWPMAASAQQHTMAVIAYCSGQQKQFAAAIAKWLKDVGKGLAELGYVATITKARNLGPAWTLVALVGRQNSNALDMPRR
jgi:hypothetical protein